MDPVIDADRQSNLISLNRRKPGCGSPDAVSAQCVGRMMPLNYPVPDRHSIALRLWVQPDINIRR
jgi:hypothetical protein